MFELVIIYTALALYIFSWLVDSICDRCTGLITAWLFYGNIFLVSLFWPLTMWYIMITGSMPFAFGRREPFSPEEVRELFTPSSCSWYWVDEPIAWRTRSHSKPPIAWNHAK